MSKSQLQDLGVVNEQLGLTQQEVESLKLQIETNLILATKTSEEIASYQKMRQRFRVLSYTELAIGVPCLTLGCLPIWTDEQQNIRNLFLGVGSTATTSGLFTFVFTISF